MKRRHTWGATLAGAELEDGRLVVDAHFMNDGSPACSAGEPGKVGFLADAVWPSMSLRVMTRDGAKEAALVLRWMATQMDQLGTMLPSNEALASGTEDPERILTPEESMVITGRLLAMLKGMP